MARTLSSSTLAAAVTATATRFDLASTTGVEVGDILYTGKEAMSVISVVSPTVTVQRGMAGTTPAAHVSGKTVWHGVPSDFYASRKSGTGNTDNEVVLPRVVLGRDGGVIQTIKDGEWVTVQDEPVYWEGDFGTVTQITNRTTGVTVNAMGGTITTDATSLAAEASAEFTVTNDRVNASDVVVASIKSGSVGAMTDVIVSTVADGSFKLKVANGNVAAGTAETGAILINFRVFKQAAI
jgi:hypothetical protein